MDIVVVVCGLTDGLLKDVERGEEDMSIRCTFGRHDWQRETVKKINVEGCLFGEDTWECDCDIELTVSKWICSRCKKTDETYRSFTDELEHKWAHPFRRSDWKIKKEQVIHD